MANDLRHIINGWDHTAWYYINTQWHNPVLDFVVPFFRNPIFWAPLYLFLAIFIPLNFGRKGFLWCAGFLITFMCADQATSNYIKPYFHRIRPCNNPALNGIVRVLVPHSNGFSFPSSHAANHFALALFCAITLGHLHKWIWPTALLWAAVVAYSQVYVGVHYPFDVFCGGILGILIGICTGKIFNRFFALKPQYTESNSIS